MHVHLREYFPCKGFCPHLSQNTREINSQYPSVNDLVQQLLVTKNNMDVIDFTSMPLLIHLALSVASQCQVSRRTHKANAILEHIHHYYIYAQLISMARISEIQ